LKSTSDESSVQLRALHLTLVFNSAVQYCLNMSHPFRFSVRKKHQNISFACLGLSYLVLHACLPAPIWVTAYHFINMAAERI
jgi:hypothetical protein